MGNLSHNFTNDKQTALKQLANQTNPEEMKISEESIITDLFMT